MLAQKLGDMFRQVNYFTSSIYTHCLLPPKTLTTKEPSREILTMTLTSEEVENVYLIDDFLTEEECRAWVKYGTRRGFVRLDEPMDEEEGKSRKSYGFTEIHNGSVASRVWQRLRAFVPPNNEFFDVETGCRNGVRICKHKKGDGEGLTKLDIVHTAMKLERAKVAVMIFLNDNFAGGDMMLYCGSRPVRDLKVEAKPGRCIFFSRGEGGWPFTQLDVTKGVKYTMHMDITYRVKRQKVSSPKIKERYKKLRAREILSPISLKKGEDM